MKETSCDGEQIIESRDCPCDQPVQPAPFVPAPFVPAPIVPVSPQTGQTVFSEWSPCPKDCSIKLSKRQAQCLSPDGTVMKETSCDGEQIIESRDCPCDQPVQPQPVQPVPAEASWTQWGPWSECPTPCGGERTRRAQCVQGVVVGDDACNGTAPIERMECPRCGDNVCTDLDFDGLYTVSCVHNDVRLFLTVSGGQPVLQRSPRHKWQIEKTPEGTRMVISSHHERYYLQHSDSGLYVTTKDPANLFLMGKDSDSVQIGSNSSCVAVANVSSVVYASWSFVKTKQTIVSQLLEAIFALFPLDWSITSVATLSIAAVLAVVAFVIWCLSEI